MVVQTSYGRYIPSYTSSTSKDTNHQHQQQQQRRIIRRPPSYYEFLATKYAEMQKQKDQNSAADTTSSSCSSSPRSAENSENNIISENSMPEINLPKKFHRKYLRKIGIGDNHCGIYVKNVVPNSAAYRDGRLEKGDQLLAVNDQSLIGISQEEAAKRISSAGSAVRFEVSKRAAYFNGIIDSLEKSTTPNTPAATVYQPIPTASTTNFPPQHQHQHQHHQQQLPTQQQQQQSFINEPLLHRHTRSASTSELFANQSDSVSLASMTNAHQYPNIQSSSRLPAHYKVSNRPAVVQPQRPYTGTQSPGPYRRAAAASPTPLYSQIVPSQQRSASTVPFNSSTMPKQNPTWLENYSNLPSIGEQQPTSYSRMPSNISHGIAAAGTTQYYSSNGSSPLPAAPPPNKDSIFSSSHQSHFPPASSAAKSQPKPAPSGRLSAPLFEHSTRSFVEPTILSVEALDRELDAIESKGSMMTLVDKERYHELLKKISELRGPAPLGQSRSTSDFIGVNGILRPTKDKQLRNPPQNFGNGIEPQHRVSKPDYTLPFMNEMASKLESKKQQQQQRPATLPKPDMLPTTSTTSFSTLIQRPQISQTEKMIDDVSQQIDRINATPLTPSTPSTSTTGPGGLPRPAMRDNSVSPEDRSKKRVQFSDTIEDVKENGHNDNDVKEEEEEEYDEGDDDDKRESQNIVVGKHEVYNDPRQRRLNEIQQKSIKPAVDGAHLAFRDKMKMFAKQANETTPKDRQKTSSAQREIEQSTDSA
uniref:PDZ domain-containing protein n=1 Tax=Panagrolaimus sp. PS1159 TaxID=55785 RepID=A0AC35G4H4_9BILA